MSREASGTGRATLLRAALHAAALVVAGCDAGDVERGAGDAQVSVDASSQLPFDAGGSPFDGGVLPSSEAGAAPADASSVLADVGSDAGSDAGPSEGGRMDGMTAAHNAVRAEITQASVPPLVWREDIAAYAQAWAEKLASSGCAIMHRSGSELQSKSYGENIAFLPARFGATASTAQAAVEAWASEEACWTYGTLSGLGKTGTEKCDVACYTNLHSDGCGHYTAIVSKRSTALGCGVATCKSGGFDYDIWVCNYNPAGNIVGQAPY